MSGSDFTAADQAFREWVQVEDLNDYSHELSLWRKAWQACEAIKAKSTSFKEWWSEYVRSRPDDVSTCVGVASDTWQACESQCADRDDQLEHENHILRERALLLESQASGFAAETVSLRERVRSAVAESDRRWMWSSHGHDGIYGDDGEMQCGECRVDYKRDPFETAQAAYLKAKATWLEKQLLDARIAEAKAHKPRKCHQEEHRPLRSPFCIFCQQSARWEERVATLTAERERQAERRALEGK